MAAGGWRSNPRKMTMSSSLGGVITRTYRAGRPLRVGRIDEIERTLRGAWAEGWSGFITADEAVRALSEEDEEDETWHDDVRPPPEKGWEWARTNSHAYAPTANRQQGIRPDSTSPGTGRRKFQEFMARALLDDARRARRVRASWRTIAAPLPDP